MHARGTFEVKLTPQAAGAEPRTGTFVLQHSGTMTRRTPQLTISVVPDSGSGEPAGLAGQMAITIADGKHSYEFDYTLPAAR
jgi:hypothetical protein